MTWSIIVAVIAACGGEAPDTEPIWFCGTLVPEPALDCAPPGTCVLPERLGILSGSRLRSRWYQGASGDRIFAGIVDTGLATDCTIEAVDDRGRCIPPEAFVVYGDPACETVLLTIPQRQYVRRDDGIAVLDPGAMHTGAMWAAGFDPMSGNTYCSPFSGPVAYQAVEVDVLRWEDLVGLDAGTSPGSSQLATFTWIGEDGSWFPELVDYYLDAPPAPFATDLINGQPCRVIADRCLPLDSWRMFCMPDGTCTFEHPGCQACDGTMRGGDSRTRVATGHCSGDERDVRVTLVATDRPCDGGRCGCSEHDRVVDYVAPEQFPLARPTLAVGNRLQLPAVAGTDGYCQAVKTRPSRGVSGPDWGHPYDRVLGIYCTPSMTAAGLRCVPESDVTAEAQRDTFLDANCTEPVAVATHPLCEACAWARDPIDDAWYTLGARRNDMLYQFVEYCVPLLPQEWWELGPRAETLFEPLTEIVD